MHACLSGGIRVGHVTSALRIAYFRYECLD